MDDYVLPPKSVLKGSVSKKNQTFGYEKRYMILG
jgi:hypothetical protein